MFDDPPPRLPKILCDFFGSGAIIVSLNLRAHIPAFLHGLNLSSLITIAKKVFSCQLTYRSENIKSKQGVCIDIVSSLILKESIDFLIQLFL